MRNRNAEALTNEEIAFLRSERAAPIVRSFVARQHEAVGVRTSAYRKVAAAAKAERDALVEVALLDIARARAADMPAVREHVAELETERIQLERRLQETQRRLAIATAEPAIAVHGEGTSR